MQETEKEGKSTKMPVTERDYIILAESFIRRVTASEDPDHQFWFHVILQKIDMQNWHEAGDGSIEILAEKFGVYLKMAADQRTAKRRGSRMFKNFVKYVIEANKETEEKNPT